MLASCATRVLRNDCSRKGHDVAPECAEGDEMIVAFLEYRRLTCRSDLEATRLKARMMFNDDMLPFSSIHVRDLEILLVLLLSYLVEQPFQIDPIESVYFRENR